MDPACETEKTMDALSCQQVQRKLNADSDRTRRIRELNDDFRRSFLGGRVLCRPHVRVLSHDTCVRLFHRVREFNDFDERNDPSHEHRGGALQFEADKYVWTIHYDDLSADPADPMQVIRVLTVMRADECTTAADRALALT
jgi:hypothetical protein